MFGDPSIYFQENSLFILLYSISVTIITAIWVLLVYNVFKEILHEGKEIILNKKPRKK